MAKRTSEDIQREIEQLKIVEQYIEDAEHYTNDEVQEIVRYALNTPYAREYIRKLRATSGLY